MLFMKNIRWVFLCVFTVSFSMNAQEAKSQPKVIHFIPTSEVVRVSTMAARDEGYDPLRRGIFLHELRTADCKSPIQGYESISLFENGHPAQTYAIRVETGDVVEPDTCTLFQYPDLMKFREETTTGFKTRPVSPGTIAVEVGCDSLKIVPIPHAH